MESYQIEHLSFRYALNATPALRDISLTVSEGEFVTVCGKSGSGKSTLLRQLKPSLAPHGEREGRIYFCGRELSALTLREQTERIGFVLQHPENQLVTDKVWHELAFGAESLGLPTPQIRARVAEMASFFGIQNWFYKDVRELSGGQKQLLNLASVMVMQPAVLLLDEPTAQLDPIAAEDFLATVAKINRELGTTVILTEHRLEEAFSLSDRVIVMEQGAILANRPPRLVAEELRACHSDMLAALPTATRVYTQVKTAVGAPKDCALKEKDACPVTVREGRAWLDGFAAENAVHTACGNTQKPKPFSDAKEDTPAVLVRDVWFRYEQNQPDVLKGLSFRVEKGQLYAIVGGNGTGKSTALAVISGVRSAYCGTVRLCGKTLPELARTHEKTVCILPQDPQTLFVRKTVALDLADMLSQQRLTQEQKDASVNAVARLCGLENLLQRHPYDLSGGEQQRAALAKVLLLKPKVLLLDEPTKGLDAHFKQTFAAILASLTSSGVTVIMVSHDIEFCARYADRCAMFFDGGIVSEGTPREFFAGKSFYTTAANRMARHLLPEAILAEDIVRACISGGTASGDSPETPNATLPEPPNGAPPETSNGTPSDSSNSTSSAMPDAAPQNGLFDFANLDFLKQTAASDRNGAAPTHAENAAEPLSQTLSDKRKMLLKRLCGILFAVLFVLAGIVCAHSPQGWQLTLARLLSVLCAALALGCLLPQKTLGSSDVGAPMPKERLSGRTWAGIAASLAAVPLTVLVGVYGFGDRKYYFISLLILLETMLPFFLSFEGRKPKAREIVLISVLCAVGVAGRAAFFMLPQFKPVAAVVILAGVCLGGESGFLVGAVTAFVSNFFFGQGPWTPWQMFAFGLIGLLGGVLFRKGALRRTKLALCVFGGLAVLVLYGGILNTASVLIIQSVPTVTQLVSAYAVGFPFDLVHAVSTVFFLWFAAEPMIEKTERVKRKYGLMESGAQHSEES